MKQGRKATPLPSIRSPGEDSQARRQSAKTRPCSAVTSPSASLKSFFRSPLNQKAAEQDTAHAGR